MTLEHEQFGFVLASTPLDSLAGRTAFGETAFDLQPRILDLLLTCGMSHSPRPGLRGSVLSDPSTSSGHLETCARSQLKLHQFK